MGDELEAIFAQIESRRGLDFRDYQRDAVLRAVDARAAARGVPTRTAYAAALAASPDELSALVAAIDIPVTRFFRAPPVFEALEHQVLPDLMRACAPSPVRALCIAVATGEEAWSLAMIAAAVAGRLRLAPPSVLATDVDPASLAAGVRAEYPAAALADVPAAFRPRFFGSAADSRVAIAPELRERVRFAQHDIVGAALMPRGAVVASFHLVLMRNLLIYFDRRLQEKALDRATAVLEPGGALVLSRVESVPPALRDRLVPYPGLPAGLRIYRRQP
ncbi:MAG: hypothetical protein HYZ29_30370 [Myxococcales bacterium]|nr:hypothetical protein [Myxococcales bacterium]